jgi:uncharacterized protein
MANPVIHVEHLSSNVAQAQTFYTKLFDWKVEPMPVPDAEPYPVVKSDDAPNVGFFGVPNGTRPYWLTYIQVDDINAAVAKAKTLGATIVEEVAEFGEYGWASVISDPTGAVFAIWEYKGAH